MNHWIDLVLSRGLRASACGVAVLALVACAQPAVRQVESGQGAPQAQTADNPAGKAGRIDRAYTVQEERNLKNVLAFYEAGLNQKDAEAATRYLGTTYKQHNPNAADGVAGFREYVDYLRTQFPQSTSQIVKSFVDGNHVILHVLAKRNPDERGTAIVDIFKLDGSGKIIEHWDVMQAIPERMAHNNGMF